METIRKAARYRAVKIVVLGSLLGATCLLHASESFGITGWLQSLFSAPKQLTEVLPANLPQVRVTVHSYDQNGSPYTGTSRFDLLRGKSTPQQDIEDLATTLKDPCPVGVAGDFGTKVLQGKAGEKLDCKAVAHWYIRRHPIAASIDVLDGDSLLNWLDDNESFKKFAQTSVFRGTLSELLGTMSIRSEDLMLSGLEGAFLQQVLREAAKGKATLHYDISHGRDGFVVKFAGKGAEGAIRSLNVALQTIAMRSYKVDFLTAPIAEMRVGRQSIYVAQDQDDWYLSGGLNALFNVLDTPASELAADSAPKAATLAVAVRSEAFLDSLTKLTGNGDKWHARFFFHLTENETKPLAASTDVTGALAGINNKIPNSLLQVIPADAAMSFALSYVVPQHLALSGWADSATKGQLPTAKEELRNEDGGIAFVWDFDGTKPKVSEIGIAFTHHGKENKAKGGHLSHFVLDQSLATTCAANSISIAATSASLLTRMKEACGGQNISLPKRLATDNVESHQAFMHFNPRVVFDQLFVAGGGEVELQEKLEKDAPKWRQDRRRALAGMRDLASEEFGQVALFGFVGKVDTAGRLAMNGFVEQRK